MPQVSAPKTREIDLVEAAMRLKCSWHTAYRLALVGKLCATRRDGRWYVELASVEELLKREPVVITRAASRR